MTTPDRPYTDDDLRTEAARQLAALAQDHDFMGIGEQMLGTEIPSKLPPAEADGAEGMHWDDLPDDDFDAAQHSIDDLLTKAADLSEWAIGLGADELEPGGYVLKIGSAARQIARVHFAFDPGLPEPVRASLVEGLAQTIADSL
jgi:hypothetical protein